MPNNIILLDPFRCPSESLVWVSACGLSGVLARLLKTYLVFLTSLSPCCALLHYNGGVAQATFAKCAKTRSKIPTLLDPADRSSSGSATSYRFKYSEPLLLCIKPFLDSLHGGEEYLTVGMVVDMVPAELSGGWHTFEGHYPSEAWGGSGFTTGASAHLRGRTFRFFSFAAVKLVDSRITGNPMLHYSSSGNTPQDLIMYHAHSYS
ncbi:hypothetical protein EV401DRAFT_1884283 [Pisolithus croceorrhizus]|nr:hypothetical protein EV401DRAFT_1884283 [Pisolithus croceorrhizus]